MNAAEHIPEIIESAILTHAEKPTHGSDYAEGVYTFFAAAKTDRVMPVKLKVKEYTYAEQDLPKNIKAYFEDNPQEYAAAYDTVVLEVEQIEESPSGSAKDMNPEGPFLSPDELSTVNVADLLDLVKGPSAKYIPARNRAHQKNPLAAAIREDAVYAHEALLQEMVSQGIDQRNAKLAVSALLDAAYNRATQAQIDFLRYMRTEGPYAQQYNDALEAVFPSKPLGAPAVKRTVEDAGPYTVTASAQNAPNQTLALGAGISYDIPTGNTDGGVTNDQQREQQSILYPGGAVSSIPENQGGARAQDGNRSSLQGNVGEKGAGTAQSSASERQHRRVNTDPDSLSEKDLCVPEKGSALDQTQRTISENYGIECLIINASAWSWNAPAFAYKGRVFISENIDAPTLATVVPHETLHVMKWQGFSPYKGFVARTPNFLNWQKPAALKLMDIIERHCGISAFAMDDAKFERLYDEMNATVYGLYVSGILDDGKYDYGEWIPGAFNDFDGYIQALEQIHEQFKNQQHRASEKDAASPSEETAMPILPLDDGAEASKTVDDIQTKVLEKSSKDSTIEEKADRGIKAKAKAVKEGVKKVARMAYAYSRPKYGKHQIEQVWEMAKNPETGKVMDPTGVEIIWDRTKPRSGQWDMGHKPGEKYSDKHRKYIEGKITKEAFLEWYRDPRNYRPELPSTNRSHKYEGVG